MASRHHPGDERCDTRGVIAAENFSIVAAVPRLAVRGLRCRQTSQSLVISPSTAQSYLKRAHDAGLRGRMFVAFRVDAETCEFT
jgi:hypothetical protein